MDQQPHSLDQARERLADFRISPREYKIVQIARNDRVRLQDFGELIAGDPLLAARVLRVANLMAGLPQVLSTVAQSISILGVDHLKALTLGTLSLMSLQVNLTGTRAEHDVALREIWEHSIGCAALAARIANKLGGVPPRLAFVAGFLHDIGRLLLYRYSREQYTKSMAVAMEKNIPLTEAETLAYGFNHPELGEIWSRSVELSADLSAVIRHHHDAPRFLPESITDEARSLARLVRLADLACERRSIGSGTDRADDVDELWKAGRLCAEEMSDELRLLQQELEASREFFGFSKADTGQQSSLGRLAVRAGAVSAREKLAAGDDRGRIIRFPGRKEHSTKAAGDASSKRLTILVVEDHGSLCEMLSLYLIRHGYHVRTADNGQAALEVLSKENVDLVLLDLMLPKMDGFAVLRRVRESRDDTKPYIIVVSAGASEKDRNRVLELGANEYMPKPFHLIRLLERIQAVEKYLLN
jgi:putative nucleotidyltransferase with HDIG domain